MAKRDEPRANGPGFTHAATGLRLPPLPRTPYNGRSAKYGTKISVEEFARQEWGDYTQHFLLYAEHLRHIDYPFYKACHYQARLRDITFAEYLLTLGILGKPHVLKPAGKYKLAALVLQEVRLREQAHRWIDAADKIGTLGPNPA